MTQLFGQQKTLVLKSITPLVLLIVASIQVYLTSTTSLTAWKGGGFGMFSTIYQREPKHWIHTSTGTFFTYEVVDLELHYAKARAMPTKKHLVSLARAFNRVAIEEGKPFLSIAVVICELQYDSEDSTVQLVPIEVEDGTKFYLLSRDGKELESVADE